MEEETDPKIELQGMFPDSKFAWLPGADAALAGILLRRSERLPGYWLSVFLDEAAKHADTAEAWKAFQKALLGDPAVLFLWPPSKDRFWDRVRSKEMPAWDNLTPAIAAVTLTPDTRTYAPVYRWNKALDCVLDSSVDPARVTFDERCQDAAAFLTNLSQLDLGPATPYFLVA